jgi:hypothetical protein
VAAIKLRITSISRFRDCHFHYGTKPSLS